MVALFRRRHWPYLMGLAVIVLGALAAVFWLVSRPEQQGGAPRSGLDALSIPFPSGDQPASVEASVEASRPPSENVVTVSIRVRPDHARLFLQGQEMASDGPGKAIWSLKFHRSSEPLVLSIQAKGYETTERLVAPSEVAPQRGDEILVDLKPLAPTGPMRRSQANPGRKPSRPGQGRDPNISTHEGTLRPMLEPRRELRKDLKSPEIFNPF